MNAQIIAFQDHDLADNAAGRVVWWSLSGDTHVGTLAEMLKHWGVEGDAPDAPSPIVALHRAVEAVARGGKSKIHGMGRGAWAIVTRPTTSEDAVGDKTLVYGVRTEAKVVGEGIAVEGDNAEGVRAAFEAASKVLSPADIGGWLCAKVERLGGAPLRPSGGVYFIPRDVAHKWTALSRAIEAASKHKMHALPAIKTADAVDAILSAVTEDVTAACAKIAEEIGTAGKRALATREALTHELLAKVGRYETILGKRLDDLREAIEATRASTAVAMLAASADDEVTP